MPGIYRQTTETTGMYSPLKNHLYRDQQIVPSKNCATQKVLPSQGNNLLHNNSKYNRDRSFEVIKNSYSLPHFKNVLNQDHPKLEYEYFYQYYVQSRKDSRSELKDNHHRREPPLPPIDYETRPYTPPEKRYSSNFGNLPRRESDIVNKRRPRSGCIYDDVHIPSDDSCVTKVHSDRNLNSTNVKVSDFPTLNFSRMYIQDDFNY